MKTIKKTIFAVFLVCFSLIKAQNIPIPKPNQLDFLNAELGVVFHYDLHVFDNEKYGQGGNRITPIPDYNIFNPKHLDTDQWIATAKAMGAKFAILTATHETGFALYQSDVNPYCMKALKFQDGKGDIVRDFVNSCRKYGIKPGIYIGIRWNSFLGIHNFKAEGGGEFAKRRQEWYKKMCEGMTHELTSRYGDLFAVWFDGGADDPRDLGPDVEPIVSKNNPNCLFYHNVDRADFRWGGSESGTVGYPNYSSFPTPFSHNKNNDTQKAYQSLLKHGDPNGKYFVPAMADSPLRGYNGRHEWFWEPDDEEAVYPLAHLMDMYEKSVGRNSTLILGLTPNPDGLLDAGDVKRLREFGEAIQQAYGNPIASQKGTGKTLSIRLKNPEKIQKIIIQEDIAKGERIREFIIEAKIKNRWVKIAEGESVGHKRIIKLPKTYLVKDVRLKVTKSVAPPIISNFSLFL
ncbi:alpha-L-fucosidase [Ornithobacterium rhinotracheale]|uniref:alpha-L-fucosidase n=1 Tax=Ornithobacterium rhinotracheale TaxID=28251 RepID=UPI001FF55857|nr:alpha-L-fucosidase [Ornithobacterium rhinotracheale]MCK0200941.1 alpha-L-fucosidase [Ornithobacterium rhinotracheale]UVD87293.1 alpha-L-fucosidase [Ornithobacterium rhinotracheale]